MNLSGICHNSPAPLPIMAWSVEPLSFLSFCHIPLSLWSSPLTPSPRTSTRLTHLVLRLSAHNMFLRFVPKLIHPIRPFQAGLRLIRLTSLSLSFQSSTPGPLLNEQSSPLPSTNTFAHSIGETGCLFPGFSGSCFLISVNNVCSLTPISYEPPLSPPSFVRLSPLSLQEPLTRVALREKP